ncbi:hypothetical protein ABIE89_005775 [Bradyrhizobium niftali]|uniref:hypothetical protein n=1 Tax=Bradyrhizobium niftali TaxID=2560055 RepID=UPI0038371AC5
MKFVLVNGRTPIRAAVCLNCCETINGSYLRDTRTRLPYCGYDCYARHLEPDTRAAFSGGGRFAWRAELNGAVL